MPYTQSLVIYTITIIKRKTIRDRVTEGQLSKMKY